MNSGKTVISFDCSMNFNRYLQSQVALLQVQADKTCLLRDCCMHFAFVAYLQAHTHSQHTAEIGNVSFCVLFAFVFVPFLV